MPRRIGRPARPVVILRSNAPDPVIPPHAIQNVKEAARIEEVVGEFVDLKRKGARFLALCPFHNEKTPSFNVTPNLGIYKCFGCGESGDAIGFLMKHEHLGYVEAIKWLAKRYNIELPEEEATPEQAAEQNERESLAVVQSWALQWSIDQLWNGQEGRRIGLSYFHERGFRDDIIRHFQLGYVPEKGDAFAKAAIANGFQPEILEKAGWIKRRDDGTPWDFFQGRITFPIHGLGGQPIAFGARTLRSDKKLPKYFNSPESALYHKSRSLYGIHFAKKAIAEQENCYLVEGYTDVIGLHQSGITNVVASSGTSLTEDQVRLIKRYSKHVTILYDGDPAGIKASLRGIDLILAEGLNVKVVLFPEGEDPDSFSRSRSSEETTAFLAQAAKDFLVFKAELLMRDTAGDPVRKAEAIHEIVESIALVPDLVLRSLYIQQCSRLLEVNEQALISEMNKVLRRQYRKQVGGGQYVPEEVLAPAVAPQQQELEDLGTVPQERDLLRMLIQYGHLEVNVPYTDEEGNTTESMTPVAEFIFHELALDEIELDDPTMRSLYLDYRHKVNLGEAVDASHYTGGTNEEWRKLAIDLLTEKHLLSPNWRDKHRIQTNREHDTLLEAVNEAIHILKERRVDRLILKQQEALKETTDDDEIVMALTKIQALNQVKKLLAKQTGRVVVG